MQSYKSLELKEDEKRVGQSDEMEEERGEGQKCWEGLDPLLLTLKVKEMAMNQGLWVASRNWE